MEAGVGVGSASWRKPAHREKESQPAGGAQGTKESCPEAQSSWKVLVLMRRVLIEI